MSRPAPTGGGDITVRSDSMTLPVWLSGHGVPLIFLHGLGSDASDSLRDLGALPGVRLAVADQRGHGRALPVHGGQFGLDSLVADLHAVVSVLRWPEPVIGGGSMGAAVALRYAMTRPAQCRALVLVAPAIADEPPAAARMIAAIADRIEAVGVERAVAEIRAQRNSARRPGLTSQAGQAPSPPDRALAQPLDDDGLDCWLRQDGRSLAIAMRAVQSWRPIASLSELDDVKLPVALVGIRNDPLHPLELAADLHRRFPVSHLEIIGSPARARQPAAIGEAVLRGLARLGIVQRAATNW